jgi:hypothetical protein
MQDAANAEPCCKCVLKPGAVLQTDWPQQPEIADWSPAPSPNAPRTLPDGKKVGGAPDKRVKYGAYDSLKSVFAAIELFSRSHDRFAFDNRQCGAPVLVCMLAGYKPDLWPLVMPRFKRALVGADICIVSPGIRSEPLAELCRGEGWSYLSTATNDVALAQNVCYRLHECADMIVKLDEDMFLLPDTITNLLAEYDNIKAAGVVDPGFVAPMIPLNGFCYRPLLDMLGLLADYEARFGIARLATAGLPVQTDTAAARWVWEHTVPLAVTADRLCSMKTRHLLCPIQFSIGLIAFERLFWELIGYLKVSRRRILAGISTLGGDEAYLCARALEVSRPAVVTTAALAGHFSFGPQYQGQIELLRHRPEIFQA